MQPQSLTADQARFSQWVSDFGPLVQAYIQSRVYDGATAEDLAQETFCRAWQAKESYIELGSPKKYLFCIADRLIIDYRRKKRAVLFPDEKSESVNEPIDINKPVEESLILSENIARLSSALEQLSDIQQRTITLRFFGQFSFAEIAEMTQMPLGTVLSHCHRALDKLKGILGSLR